MKMSRSYKTPATEAFRAHTQDRMERVGDIIADRPLLTFRANDKIEYIVHEMMRHHQGAVGITENNANGVLLGILTERDILRKIFGTYQETQAQFDARNHHLSVYPGTLAAQNVMTANPLSLMEDMPIDVALEKIKRYGFRYMPVVSKDNDRLLIGIVSERELFWHTQEILRRTIQTQTSLLSYFIEEPYGSGASIDYSPN